MRKTSSLLLAMFTLGLILLSGCDSKPADGPKKVRWDRDFCEMCRMLLSDRHYAAQILDAKGKYHLFDDPGEMLLTFATKYKNDSAAKLYVADSKNGKWLDARTASYSSGHLTPMGFGYGASEKPEPDSKNFTTILSLILAGETGAPTPQKPNPKSGFHNHNMSETDKHTHMQH
ncbi:MAG: protein NosL [Magnetococcales bacterium]|nr:protein NosL [Magnetococcales bacterium]